jgi:hypothetical protein
MEVIAPGRRRGPARRTNGGGERARVEASALLPAAETFLPVQIAPSPRPAPQQAESSATGHQEAVRATLEQWLWIASAMATDTVVAAPT